MQKPIEKPIKFKKNAATLGKTYPVTHIEAVVDGNGKTLLDILDQMQSTIPNTSGSVMSYTDSSGATHYVATSNDPSGINSNMTNVTWLELKNLRDNFQLITGSLYRIIDYNCTTTLEYIQSAGHQFDIVLLALSENKLAEEGWAMEHPTDVYDVTFYDGFTKKCYLYVNSIYEDEGKIYESWNLIDIDTMLGIQLDDIVRGETAFVDNNNKQISFLSGVIDPIIFALDTPDLTYNYFQNSNLSAWKVWYCLDNDKSRFAWADDNVIGDIENVVVYYPERISLGGTVPAHDVVYTLTNETQIVNGVTYFKLIKLEGVHTSDEGELLVDTKNINTETTLYAFEPRSDTAQASPWNISIKSINYNTPPTEEGRGVIYRLIDEWNNDVGYDFKNIQFIRPMADGEYTPDGEDAWCYTFSYYNDSTSTIIDSSLGVSFNDGEGGYIIEYSQSNVIKTALILSLPNNVLLDICCDNIIRDSSGNTFIYLSNSEIIRSFNINGLRGIPGNNGRGSLILMECDTLSSFPTISNIIISNTPLVQEP